VRPWLLALPSRIMQISALPRSFRFVSDIYRGETKRNGRFGDVWQGDVDKCVL